MAAFLHRLLGGATVWAWGDNLVGQLGNGTMTSSASPVQVTGLTDVTTIAGSDLTGYAVLSGGTVWAWGLNSNGQLGNGSFDGAGAVPSRVTALTDVTAIASNGCRSSSYALRSDGTVWAWGGNTRGELGSGALGGASFAPVQVPGLTDITAIASCRHTAYAIRSDGTVWAWGENGNGKLGNGSAGGPSLIPVQVSGLKNATSVAAGWDNGYALRSDGTVWAWGVNERGQLGNGTTVNSTVPVQVSGLTGVTAIASGAGSGYALRSDGTVWVWGLTAERDASHPATTPTPIVGLTAVTAVTAIAAGARSLYAIR